VRKDAQWTAQLRNDAPMPVESGESTERWSERAIVANSVAAAHEESLADAGNPTARRVASKRADEASTDLEQALDALRAERRVTDTG
jgi:hypothetical protein